MKIIGYFITSSFNPGKNCSSIASPNEELRTASKNGNSTQVNFILKYCEKADVNTAGPTWGLTPLILAAIEGHVEVVRLLLKQEEININKASYSQRTALYFASKDGHASIVELLLQKKDININRAYSGGETALYVACYMGQMEVVQLLLDKEDIDVNKANNYGITAFRIAYDHGFREVVQLLLENPKANVTKGLSTDEDIIHIIEDSIFNEDIPTNKVTVNAYVGAILGNVSTVSALLLSNRTSVNSLDRYHRTLIYWAATRGHQDVIKLLLSQADILVNLGRSSDGANALYQASRFGLLDTVSTLLDHPMTNVNYVTLERKTALMVSTIYGHAEIVKKLLSHVRIDVNLATFDGTTALSYAVQKRQSVILELLLRCPNTITSLQDEKYKTALDRAKEENHAELIALFHTRGDLQIEKGHTCCSATINRGLHVAVENDDLPWIEKFIVCPGLELNIRNKGGYTPLNLATESGWKKMVEIFLKDQRIDVNKPNTGMKDSSLIIATKKGHVDILILLLHHNQTFVNQQNDMGQSALSIAVSKYAAKPHPQKYFRIVKLLIMCPKTDVSNKTFPKKDVAPFTITHMMEIVNIRSFSINLTSTCCSKVYESLLGAAWVGDFRAIRGLLTCPVG